MKWQMSENSLFAVLLRSPWWVSFLVAAGVFALMRYFLPVMYAFAGALPFAVIGTVAGWKQFRAPSAKKIAAQLDALRQSGWEDFARALETGFKREGYEVTRTDGAADFALERNARLTLVAAKRWKASRTGVEPLRELAESGQKKGAEACWYLCAGEMTENARTFARDKAVKVVEGAELAALARARGGDK
jgi:restriction system protein